MPHGQCVNWDEALILCEVLSNLIIATAYFAIPIALMVIVRRYEGFKANAVIVMFAAFIVSCGSTHIMDIITIWWPIYWVDAFVRIVTAISSILVAWVLLVKNPFLEDYFPRRDHDKTRNKSFW